MSHELRTPLNAIIGYSEMLVEEADDEGWDGAVPDLTKIIGSSRHLLGLINDLLDLSKVEAGRMEPLVESFQVPDLVAEIRDAIEPLARRGLNRLEVACPPDLGAMQSDLVRTRQCLLNLLSNAAKFTSDGTIGLTVEARGDSVAFLVRDTGIGMTAGQMERLFNPFSQAETSTARTYGGTGLGLALSRSFARMLGGDIVVTSQPREGSTFTLTLPRRFESRQTVEPDAVDRVSVLMIGVDPQLGQQIRGWMDADAVDVHQADGADAALAASHLKRPAAIVAAGPAAMDDGLFAALRRDPVLQTVPTVALAPAVLADGVIRVETATELPPLLRRLVRGSTTAVVMIVDDDHDERAQLARALRSAGLTTLDVAGGTAALAALDQLRPGLILLDIVMPDLDGLELIARLAARPEMAAVPIVIVTHRDMDEADRRLLPPSVVAVLRKSCFDRDTLVATVTRHLGS
jgi:CheY-like chemotaxis protein